MIDLDEVWNPAEELYCQFGLLLITDRMKWQDFKRITEFLGIYGYVFPASRIMYAPLLESLFEIYKKKERGVFKLALLISEIETNFTERKQVRLLEILQDAEIKGTCAPACKIPENGYNF